MNPDWLRALVGGILIGISVSLMLFWNGRVTGISGILYGALKPFRGDIAWRVAFLLGLVAGGLVTGILNSAAFHGALSTSDWSVAIAGLLVGFGTVLGSGCTSGHGVCGISRLSIRSLLATVLFVMAGIFSVFLFRHWGVLS